MHTRSVLPAAGLLLLLAACDRNGRSDLETSLLTTTESGDLVMGSGEITSERYKRWLAAARALESVRDLPSVRGLRSGSIMATDAERAIAALEAHAGARRALAQAGMSVREYVMTTIALEQQMRVAGAGGRLPPTPDQEFIPEPDTVGLAPIYGQPDPLPQPYPAPEPYPSPQPYPSPAPLPLPTPTVRVPPPQTTPAETLAAPVPRDTQRLPRESPPSVPIPTPPTPTLPRPNVPPPPTQQPPITNPPPADTAGAAQASTPSAGIRSAPSDTEAPLNEA
jgi:hypothetical protein